MPDAIWKFLIDSHHLLIALTVIVIIGIFGGRDGVSKIIRWMLRLPDRQDLEDPKPQGPYALLPPQCTMRHESIDKFMEESRIDRDHIKDNQEDMKDKLDRVMETVNKNTVTLELLLRGARLRWNNLDRWDSDRRRKDEGG